MPSVEGMIRQARLKYLAQIGNTRADQLRDLIADRSGGKPTRWAKLVCDDLVAMHAALPFETAELGDPRAHPEKWFAAARNHPNMWKELVSLVVVCESVCDRKSLPHAEASDIVCVVCNQHFKSERAASMHRRVVHGESCKAKCFAPQSGQCPICGIRFSTRLRLIAHLTEKRFRSGKAPCGQELHKCKPLDPAEVARLDDLDRQARQQARRQGRTQPRTTCPPLPTKRKRLYRKSPPELLFGIVRVAHRG